MSLILDGTTGVQGNSGAFIADTAKTATGTSVDFTGIPSWVKRITVMFSGVSTNGTSEPLVQIGTSSGVEATGYVSTSVNAIGGSTSVASSSTAGFNLRSILAANIISGQMVITLVGSNTWISSHTAKGSATFSICGAGDKTLSDTLTQVRITTVNGTDTFDAGTINILYE